MSAKTGVTENGSGFDIKAAFALLRDHQVVVGIPQEKAGRAGSVSNAELLFIHTNGSPKNRLPARPVIEPAIEDKAVQERIGQCFQRAILSASEGDAQSALNELDLAGQYGENAARDRFTNNDWPPLKGGIRRVRSESLHKSGSHKGRHIWRVQTNPMPLVDTGSLRAAITHEVIKRGG